MKSKIDLFEWWGDVGDYQILYVYERTVNIMVLMYANKCVNNYEWFTSYV